ncbi:MAG: exodeoxyribonuclease VII small subunit [Phycisphaeraceae bacterium]|nr:exodeoxyribonuclease VII small subunit [Phycisphaerae bacterium]MBX3392964.1 exodeoxyribonuclease VII small subunit [Phycisphaeraceae bacterium]
MARSKDVTTPALTPATPPPPDDGPSFEDLLGEIEEIIRRVESGEIGLERSIAEYERGVGLLKRCRAILTTAEQKVETLSRTLTEETSQAPGDRPGTGPAAGPTRR